MIIYTKKSLKRWVKVEVDGRVYFWNEGKLIDMSNKITYGNKEQYTVLTLPEKYKFTYLNANEIKTVVNAIDDRVVSLEEDFYISFDFKKRWFIYIYC